MIDDLNSEILPFVCFNCFVLVGLWPNSDDSDSLQILIELFFILKVAIPLYLCKIVCSPKLYAFTLVSLVKC